MEPETKEMQQAREWFEVRDLNRDGKIDGAEMKEWLGGQGMTLSEDAIQTIISHHNSDGKEGIEFEDFMRLYFGARTMFDRIDVDKDGHITKEEVVTLQSLSNL